MSASSSQGPPPVVRIGCCPIPLQRLQSFLGALHVAVPCLETEVLHLATFEQLARLGTGDLDLAVIEFAAPAPPLQVEPLYAGEPLAALLPTGHGLSAQPAVRPGELVGETRVSSPRAVSPASHDAVDVALAAAGHHLGRRRETAGADPFDVLLAVAQGQGVAVEPLSALRRAGEFGALLTGRPLEPPVHLSDTMLGWRAGPAGPLDDAIDAARAVARELHAFSSRR